MKRVMSIFIVQAFLALVAGVCPARADGLIVVVQPGLSPHLPYGFAPLAVKYHHVSVRIDDQVASTEVDQVFYNPTSARLEGTYLFPIPSGAQIDRFSMDIDGRMVDAELLDSTKARRIYEDIVRRMRDPALLEYSGQGLFKVRIFPIEPHSEKRVRLHYTQVLRRENGLVQYIYPLNTEKFSAQPVGRVAITVELNGSRDLQSIYSPTHEVEVRRKDPRHAVVGFEASQVRPDIDFQLFFSYRPDEDVGLNLMTYRDVSDAGYFLLLASPSASVADDQIARKDVVFVLDTSGSMAEDGKLDQARKALNFCFRNLNPGDRFEVIRFATEAEPLFRSLVPADRTHLDRASSYVAGLKPTGGTAIADALAAALAPSSSERLPERPFMVVFLTDGRPTVGVTDENRILERVRQNMAVRPARIFSFGIGTDINTHLLDRITEETRGASQYVLPKEDIEVSVSGFYAKISQPVLANLHLDFSDPVQVSQLQPVALPDLFKGEQLMLFGRYRGSGKSTITLSGSVNGRRRTFTYPIEFPEQATSHSFISRLWATRRVGFLLDQIRLHGENPELRDEVTDLARRYGIITPYTAYLIIEDETRRAVPIARQTLQTISGRNELRDETRRMYEEMGAAKSGYGAVGGAQTNSALKSADVVGAPAAANALAVRGQAEMGAQVRERVDQVVHSQQSRTVAGRTFYQNGNQWIDAGVQSRTGSRSVRIQFNSDEYFTLMSRHPDMPRWLSLGPSIQVILGDTVYEIYE